MGTTSAAHGVLERIGSALRRFTLRAARNDEATGQSVFHDLLVLARASSATPVH